MSEQERGLNEAVLITIGAAAETAMRTRKENKQGFEDAPGFEGYKDHVVSRRLGGFVESVINDPRNKGTLSIWAVALFFNQADPDFVLLQSWDRKDIGTLMGILQKEAVEVYGEEKSREIENIRGGDGRFDPKLLKVDVFGIAGEAIKALRQEKLLPEPLAERLRQAEETKDKLFKISSEQAEIMHALGEENERLRAELEQIRGGVAIDQAAAGETPEEKPAEVIKPIEPVKQQETELELPDWLKALQEPPSRTAGVSAPAGVSAKTEKPAAQPNPEPAAPKPVQVNSVGGIAHELKEKGGTAEVKFGPQVLRSVVEATFARIINEQVGKGPRPTVNINEFRVDSGMELAGNIQVAGRTIPVYLQIGPILNYVRHNVGEIPTIPLLFNTKQRDELLRTVEQRLQRVRDEIYLTIKDQMSMDVNLTNMIDPRIEGQDMIATFRGKAN